MQPRSLPSAHRSRPRPPSPALARRRSHWRVKGNCRIGAVGGGDASGTSPSPVMAGWTPPPLTSLPLLPLLLLLPPLVAGAGDAAACSSWLSCGACVLSPGCSWCTAQNGERYKCVAESDRARGECHGPPTTRVIAVYQESNSPIAPERVTASLRVREEFKFNLTYKKLPEYPVDIYFLIGLSSSMQDDLENLAKLGEELAATMEEASPSIRLGFGSFMDKVAQPMGNSHPLIRNHSCTYEYCVQPHSFQNHLSLTGDTTHFTERVQRVASALDGRLLVSQEGPGGARGALDALMQVVVCEEDVGWRREARRLAFVVSNGPSHVAGDGRLSGVVEPNDERCHLQDNVYTHALRTDYPSISQINRKAIAHSVSIIFANILEEGKEASSRNNSDPYYNLIHGIRGSSNVTLRKHSTKVKEAILKYFKKQTEAIKLTDDSAEKDIGVSYSTDCSKNDWFSGSSCEGVAPGARVTFEVSIKVNTCPPQVRHLWKESITLTPIGIQERVLVHLEIHCGCSCEYEGNPGYEKNSSGCSFQGDKKCGNCQCYDAYTGNFCQCAKDEVTNKESDDKCISNRSNHQICNDRGRCVCNLCNCFKRHNPEEVVSGSLCECDNFSCLRWGGSVCGGAERGTCTCGECVCQPGWTGDDCSCPDGPGVCRAPHDDSECSGAGRCECGKCVCAQGITGQFCEDCTNCSGGRCKTLAKCVEYLVHKTGKYNEDVCSSQNITQLEIETGKVNGNEESLMEKFHSCWALDEAGCSFVFYYEEKEGRVVIFAEEEKECPVPLDLLGIAFGVIGGTFLIGLISILIWKLITTVHDEREYQKFERERAQSKWERGENPLYIQATSTFTNPTYCAEK